MELFAASAVLKTIEQCYLLGELLYARSPQMQLPIPLVNLLD